MKLLPVAPETRFDTGKRSPKKKGRNGVTDLSQLADLSWLFKFQVPKSYISNHRYRLELTSQIGNLKLQVKTNLKEVF